MHQGNWKCSKCGAAITELPFEPKSESGLTCRACYAKSKNEAAAPAGAAASGEQQQSNASNADGNGSGDRPQFKGDWKCASCGAAIASLPFEPRSTENLKCLDCFKSSKA